MDQLPTFHTRLKALLRRATPYGADRHATQKDLAAAIGLHEHELSERLRGRPGARLVPRDIQAIIRTLADWEVLTTQAEAQELLDLLACSPFTPAEWQAPPLDRLAPAAPGPPLPAPPAGTPPIHNLPQPLTCLVGREAVLAEVDRLVSQHRLVTLTGPGGSGKTRLALAVGSRLLPTRRDGVWLIELAALTDPALIAPALAGALGVREAPGQPLLAALTAFLQPRALLLLLDNCEHLIEAVARLAQQLLARAPLVHVLTTSREPLGVTGEVIWPVLPLALPAPGQDLALAALGRVEAIQLFVARATAVVPGFALTPETAPAVRAVCAQLDGLPLALELAAARLRVLAVTQLPALLAERFLLLTAGSRAAPPRQQTLQATLDWSYDLLTAAERRLFRQTEVFAGGFDLEALAAVATADGRVRPALVTRLAALVDKSLVEREAGAAAAPARYRLLETIHAYAQDRATEAGESAEQARRHAGYYLALAEQAAPALRGPAQAAWLDRLTQEHPNLRAALAWAQAQPDPTLALRFGGALWGFWMIRGHWSEGCRGLEDAWARGADAPPALRARVLEGLGWLNWTQDHLGAAQQWYEASLALYRAVDDAHAAVLVLTNLSSLADAQGDAARAQRYGEESLALAEAHGDRPGRAHVLARLGSLALRAGDIERGIALYEESLISYRELGNQGALASHLTVLGYAALMQGDYATARARCAESLTHFRTLGNRGAAAIALGHLGYAALGAEDLETAGRHFAASLTLTRTHGFLGQQVASLVGLAAIAYRGGRLEQAAQLCGAVAGYLEQAEGRVLEQVEQTVYEHTVADLQARVAAAAYTAARTVGQTWSLEHALAAALVEAQQTAL